MDMFLSSVFYAILIGGSIIEGCHLVKRFIFG